MLLLTTTTTTHHTAHPTSSVFGGNEVIYLAAIAALVLWVVLYLVYRVVMTGRKDFGMPVKRRLLAFRLRVDRDQRADVPFWWTDLQIQRAIRSHWRNTLRSPFASGSEGQPAS
jgi:hypothetical protein